MTEMIIGFLLGVATIILTLVALGGLTGSVKVELGAKCPKCGYQPKTVSKVERH